MSQIGFVKQEQMAVRRDGKEEIVKWFECHFRVAGIRPFSAKMSPNKKKEKENQPDYYIYLRANINKGDRFRDIRIGALWMKKKTFEGVEKTFMTGNISIAFIGELPITVWKAEPRYEGEKIEYLYDISTMKEREQPREDTGHEVSYEEAEAEQPPTIDINEEEIPF